MWTFISIDAPIWYILILTHHIGAIKPDLIDDDDINYMILNQFVTGIFHAKIRTQFSAALQHT